MSEAVIVKVQLPIDAMLARITGKMYASKTDTSVLVYDEQQRCVMQGEYPALRLFMLAADGGVGYVKAYMWATPRPTIRPPQGQTWVRVGAPGLTSTRHRNGTWDIDFERGFAPMQPW